MKTSFVCLACFSGMALLGCGPSLTLEGARAKVAPADAVARCSPISSVEGTGGSLEKAEIDLRNKAGTMNADRVVITDTAEAGGSVRLTGKAYGCASAQTGGPEAP